MVHSGENLPMVHSGENRLIQSFQDGVAKIFVMYESRNLKWGIATLTTSVRYTYWYSVWLENGYSHVHKRTDSLSG